MPGGSQDLQRGKAGGVPPGEVNPIFKDSASWNFGYIMQQVEIPNQQGEAGAGGLKTIEGIYGWFKSFGQATSPGVKNSATGPFGMDPGDAVDFNAGVQSAIMAGHHKAIIDNSAPELGPLAPFHMAPKTSQPKGGDQQHAAAEDIHAVIMSAMAQSPGEAPMRPSGASVAVNAGFLDHASGAFAVQEAMSNAGGVAPRFTVPNGRTGSVSLHAGSQPDGLHDTSETLAAHFSFEQASAGVHSVHDAFVLDSCAERQLPSMAPRLRSMRRNETSFAVSPHEIGPNHILVSRKNAQGKIAASPMQKTAFSQTPAISEVSDYTPVGVAAALRSEMKAQLIELLDAEARRPPSGMTGFDPRLSPAWAGLKLSV